MGSQSIADPIAFGQIMEICYQAGVKTVTVYAFSIENFNRPKYEVEGLMQLAKVKLEQLTTYGDVLDRYGAAVRVIGQRELIRDDVLEVVDKAVARTRNNQKSVCPREREIRVENLQMEQLLTRDPQGIP
jgi:ditrans,polycis-polyprenyl diphosphate synthase